MLEKQKKKNISEMQPDNLATKIEKNKIINRSTCYSNTYDIKCFVVYLRLAKVKKKKTQWNLKLNVADEN